MSKWTHTLCERCWRMEEPGRAPILMKPEYRLWYQCCLCRELTNSGIWYRKDPESYLCKGMGEAHEYA